MYAIIATGGKQYKVSEGDVIRVEKIDAQVGQEISFPVLMLGGETVTVGSPMVEGANVSATVLAHGKGEKVLIYKYKSKKNYHRRAGHRQLFTEVKITAVKA